MCTLAKCEKSSMVNSNSGTVTARFHRCNWTLAFVQRCTVCTVHRVSVFVWDRTLNLQCVWNCHFLLFFASIWKLFHVSTPRTNIRTVFVEFFAFLWLCTKLRATVDNSHTNIHNTMDVVDMMATAKSNPENKKERKEKFYFHAMELNVVVVIIKTRPCTGLLSFASCNLT